MRNRVSNRVTPSLWVTLILVCIVFSSCAAVGKMIQPEIWLGVLDLFVAGAITVYIFRGGDKG